MSRLDDRRAVAAQADRRRRTWAAVHRSVLPVLLLTALALLAVLSVKHAHVSDWTHNARNSLSAASEALLERMPEPIRIEAFIDDSRQLREAVRQLVERYQRRHPHVSLELVDPELEPRRTREAGIRDNATLVVSYRERVERVTALSERALSAALARLARAGQRWIAYLHGAGERDLLGERREDLGLFGRHLESLGFSLRPLRLSESPQVPDNVSLLVVLEPRTAPLPGNERALLEHVRAGGNVLWLSDAAHHGALDALETELGLEREQGMLVDPESRLDGRPTPEFIIITGYASHPLTARLDSTTVFPTATSVAWTSRDGFRARGIAASPLSSWLETGDLSQAVAFDDGADTPGPLDLAVVLERERSDGRVQRIVVFGDADFLSNAYVGLAGNRELGSATVEWLAGDDALLDIPTLVAPDLGFAPSSLARAVIALGAPIGVPLLILIAGALHWRRRRAL